MPRAALPSGRKLLILLALTVVVAIGGAWWWQRPPPEPVVNGQRLSEWLVHSNPHPKSPHSRSEPIQSFGPAAIPWLAYTIEHGRHPFARSGRLPFDRAPRWLRRWLPERWGGLRLTPVSNGRTMAAWTLASLGAEAAAAGPALARSLRISDHVDFPVAFALQSMGPASWPEVQDVLQHGSNPGRIALLQTLNQRVGLHGMLAKEGDLERVTDALIKACRDPDAAVRAAGAKAVVDCKVLMREPPTFESTIPELTRLLSDADSTVRRNALAALSAFGATAFPSIAGLIERLDDPLPEIRAEAARCLWRVDKFDERSADRLRAMLHDPDPHCRAAAFATLRGFGFAADGESVGAQTAPASSSRKRIRVRNEK
jgi:hypothetical protein